jgi:hypothetical protein
MAGEKKQDEQNPPSPEPVELTDDALAHVSGGMHGGSGFGGAVQKVSHGLSIEQDVAGNKAKTADKAYNAMDAYIKG